MQRRSIRSYREEQIKEEELNDILQAGMYAPSAGNQQPWHFTVIQNKEIMQNIRQELKEYFKKSKNKMFKKIAESENFDPFHNAPAAVIVSGDEKALLPLCTLLRLDIREQKK
ncbi:MAG: nitroreductase family protein [Clostridiales bacterium]|nr:nitroreductase family protein [Clostridiales bacterium]MCF8021274.1 nitroreductase family protein [Clostridiales bacterium]